MPYFNILLVVSNSDASQKLQMSKMSNMLQALKSINWHLLSMFDINTGCSQSLFTMLSFYYEHKLTDTYMESFTIKVIYIEGFFLASINKLLYVQHWLHGARQGKNCRHFFPIHFFVHCFIQY